MPTIITSTSFSTTFNFNSTPKQFVFTDTTDITTPSIPAAGVRDIFMITDPNGNIIYNNTNFAAPDILRSVGATNTTTIPLPLLPDGTVVTGTYTIVMSTQIIDGVNPTYVLQKTNTYTNSFQSPTISINQVVNCISPLFTSVDATNYVVNGVTPTISGTHTIYFPTTPTTSIQQSFISSGNSLSTGSFYSGIQTSKITVTLTYTFSDGLVVTQTLTGQKSIVVDCTFICSIYCCLRTLEQNMMNAKGTNDVMYQKYKDLFEQVMGLVELTFLAVDCGKQNDAAGYIASIKELAQCTDDCSCNDGTPQLVTGLGATSINVVVASCGAPITVTGNTVGNTTTYTVCFDPALASKLNALYNTNIVSTDSSVSISSATSGYTKTYDLSVALPAEKNWMSWKTRLQFSGANTITITTSDVTTSGTKPSGAPSVTRTSGTAANNNLFTVNSFLTVATTTYKVLVNKITTSYGSPTISGLGLIPQPTRFIPETILYSNGAFAFRLTDTLTTIGGIPPTYGLLCLLDLDITLHFHIELT